MVERVGELEADRGLLSDQLAAAGDDRAVLAGRAVQLEADCAALRDAGEELRAAAEQAGPPLPPLAPQP